jgi:hypothetical protein
LSLARRTPAGAEKTAVDCIFLNCFALFGFAGPEVLFRNLHTPTGLKSNCAFRDSFATLDADGGKIYGFFSLKKYAYDTTAA